jgi:hypothetical protein
MRTSGLFTMSNAAAVPLFRFEQSGARFRTLVVECYFDGTSTLTSQLLSREERFKSCGI